MPLPDDDRSALAARLVTLAPGAVEVIDASVEDGEDVRDVLVDVDRQVVVLTDRRVLFVDGDEVRQFDYGAVEVRRRDDGLGIDAVPSGGRLVLEVARSTFVRLGVVGEGGPPSRATWLPVRSRPAAPTAPTAAASNGGGAEAPAQPHASAPAAAPAPAPEQVPPSPPPGWHPDPSGRHWWRWWDGRGWTEHVADGGAPFIDPLPR